MSAFASARRLAENIADDFICEDLAVVLSSHRVFRRKGRVSLIETANPLMGIGYPVKIGTLVLWSGGELDEAETQFVQASFRA